MTGKESYDKGITFEDTVELWLQAQGLKYERRKKLQTPIGLVEIDFFVEDEKGRVVVEAKNLSKPVDRDIVLKAWNTAQAVGAYKVIVISASGFTESAVKFAKGLERAELLNLEDLLRDLRARRPETIYARKRVSREGVIMWAEREVAERLLFFLRTEHVKEAEEVYLPLYLVRCNVSAGRGKYRDARILASGLTGLPVALRKGAFVEVGEALANVPDDVLELYKKYAGEQVSRAYFVKRHGEAAWNKLVRYLTQAGLATKISERPAVIELKDVLPSLDKLEEAGATIERGEPREGRRLDHLYTPGSVVLLLERLLDAKVKAIFPLYAPAYLVKLVDRSGNYRIVAVAAWTESPRLYVSNYFTTGSL